MWPSGHGGPDVTANWVTGGANGHYAVHAVLDWMLKTGGVPPWQIRRRYGRKMRAMAEHGYESIQCSSDGR